MRQEGGENVGLISRGQNKEGARPRNKEDTKRTQEVHEEYMTGLKLSFLTL
jgi:hypothetical protein